MFDRLGGRKGSKCQRDGPANKEFNTKKGTDYKIW